MRTLLIALGLTLSATLAQAGAGPQAAWTVDQLNAPPRTPCSEFGWPAPRVALGSLKIRAYGPDRPRTEGPHHADKDGTTKDGGKRDDKGDQQKQRRKRILLT